MVNQHISCNEAVQSLPALRFGRTDTRETEPVTPVADAWVEAVLPYLSPQVAAMVRLQRLAAMRPCEVVLMRACDIDRSGEIWIYEPYDHKNRWRGHRRLIPLGPQVQAIIRPFLTLKTDTFLFSPRQAEVWRNEQRRKRRQTPMTPSQAKRKPKASPQRAKRDRYDTDSYRRAITYGIRAANRQRERSYDIEVDECRSLLNTMPSGIITVGDELERALNSTFALFEGGWSVLL